MNYELEFVAKSWKEWKKLANPVKIQFKKKLLERLKQPKIISAQLTGMKSCYKIKLRGVGYRLVYQVKDDRLIVLVLAVGKRERNFVYKTANKRL